MKLVYIGKMPDFDMRLWNIIDPTSPYHRSSRSLEGLIELGIVPAKGDN